MTNDNYNMSLLSAGAGIFVSAIVVGAICITTNFTLTSRPFLRDVIFYIAAVAWTFAILWKGKVYLGEAIGKVTESDDDVSEVYSIHVF